MLLSWTFGIDYQHELNNMSFFSLTNLGRLFRGCGSYIISYSISTPNMDDMEAWSCGEFVYSHDVDSNPWFIRLVWELIYEVRY